MMIYTSEYITEQKDLYQFQDLRSSGIPFKYQLTDGEVEWAYFLRHRYEIADWVIENTDDQNVLTFGDYDGLTAALKNDGMHPKAVMLSENSALHRLFLWLS